MGASQLLKGAISALEFFVAQQTREYGLPDALKYLIISRQLIESKISTAKKKKKSHLINSNIRSNDFCVHIPKFLYVWFFHIRTLRRTNVASDSDLFDFSESIVNEEKDESTTGAAVASTVSTTDDVWQDVADALDS